MVGGIQGRGYVAFLLCFCLLLFGVLVNLFVFNQDGRMYPDKFKRVPMLIFKVI